MFMHTLYIYINPITKVPFYIGEGKVGRSKQHWSKVMNGKPTHNRMLTQDLLDLLVIGLAPIISIQNVKCKNDALVLEESLVKQWGRRGKEPGGVLCNRCARGSDNTGTGHYSTSRSAVVRNKISKGHIGKSKPKHTAEHNAKISASLSNRKFTDQHRANLSAACTGLTHVVKPRTTFVLKKPDGSLIEVEGKLDAFCLEQGLNRKSLYNTLKTQLPLRIGRNAGWQMLSV